MSSACDLISPADVSDMSEAELRKLENRIARKHSGMFPYGIVIWAFGNMAVWFLVWALVLTDIMPLWLGFIIAIFNLSLVYLPTHDAQHDIIARPGQKLRWLNELVGHATSWIIVYPFNTLRVTHMDHHRHTNNPELDPDITTRANGPWDAIWRSIREKQPNGKRSGDYLASLARNGRHDLILLAIFYQIAFVAALSLLAWRGLALEAFFLWWLPLQISQIYLLLFLSWAPHHPHSGQGRYRDTRNWRSKAGNILSMGMQYHIVHHLHPYIPLLRTGEAYFDMKLILEVRGCEMEM